MVDVSHMAQAMNGMREAFARMEGALNRVCEQLAESMPHPDECHGEVRYAERRAEPFRHTDRDGDTLEVAPVYDGPEGTLYVHLAEGKTAHLSQTAVNELAQYLDRYRTDIPKVVANPDASAREHWCGKSHDHAAHIHGKHEVLRCLGSSQGYYGEADDTDAVRTGQPPSHLIGALCAGHFPDRAADKTGCNCFREVHGALGCTVPGSPCERRGGR